MIYVYKIAIAPGISYECAGEQSLELLPGKRVVVRGDRFCDIGTVEGVAPTLPCSSIEALEEARAKQNRGRHLEGRRLPQIIRLANEADIKADKANDKSAEEIHWHAVECIKRRKLEMKLIRTRYSLDRKVIFFQFSAEARVDFRELLRDLSGSINARVELRQIGVRDEAAILGGIGPCGRCLCCSRFLSAVTSVNVKTVKQQGISLNPQNVSGCCGRLRCCLQFEAECNRKNDRGDNATPGETHNNNGDGEMKFRKKYPMRPPRRMPPKPVKKPLPPEAQPPSPSDEEH
jgi:cell fate regulator YaaT (PSP1 superfamily)